MEMIVTGGTATQRKHAEGIAWFSANKLMPRMDSLIVNIKIKSFGKDDTLGYCLPDDDANEARPREFNIEINKQIHVTAICKCNCNCCCVNMHSTILE